VSELLLPAAVSGVCRPISSLTVRPLPLSAVSKNEQNKITDYIYISRNTLSSIFWLTLFLRLPIF